MLIGCGKDVSEESIKEFMDKSIASEGLSKISSSVSKAESKEGLNISAVVRVSGVTADNGKKIEGIFDDIIQYIEKNEVTYNQLMLAVSDEEEMVFTLSWFADGEGLMVDTSLQIISQVVSKRNMKS